jgi:hypothetical protein
MGRLPGLVLAALLAAGGREPPPTAAADAGVPRETPPKPDEWKCVTEAAGGRVLVQIGGGLVRRWGSEIDVRLQGGATTLFASEAVRRPKPGHRVTGPIPFESGEAQRSVAELFAALQPQPRPHLVSTETGTRNADGTFTGGVVGSIECGYTDGPGVSIQFWCGAEAHGPFRFISSDCDLSGDPAGRVLLWADAIFEEHQASPFVEDPAEQRERSKQK